MLGEVGFRQISYHMSAGFAGRHAVGFGDLSIDVFLEVHNKSYSQILHLIYYIAYGLHLWYKLQMFKEISWEPISLHPGLGNSLQNGNIYPGIILVFFQDNQVANYIWNYNQVVPGS